MIKRSVGTIDGMAACLGKALYVEDLAPADALHIKLVKSPYAFADIISIDDSEALKTEGVACVLTYKDVPQKPPITLAAEAYTEGSTHDRTILQRTVRFIGEPVAAVAAETEKIAEDAAKKIKVTYRVREPEFNFEHSIDNGHPMYTDEEVFTHFDNGSTPSRNIIAKKDNVYGDISFEEAYEEAPVKVSGRFYTQAQMHVQAETHRCCCIPDADGSLTLYSSCQAAFNTQRLIAEGLGIPTHRLRVIKPKVGGAFGGKNTMFFEGIAAGCAMKTNRPCLFKATRRECFAITNTRHASRVDVKIGADKEGRIEAMDVKMLIDGGGHGEHSFDVLCVGCGNSLPMYRAGKALRFTGCAAYTNLVPAGAFRGFGGPQVAFALEGAMSELADKIGVDSAEIRLRNITHEGEKHPFVSGGMIHSSTLNRMIERGKKLIGWDRYYPCRRIDDHTIEAVGMSVAMHGSGIGGMDHCMAVVSQNYDGSFTVFSGACNLGTGADTILIQMASQVLNVDMELVRIVVSDTAITTYDKGAYASSTTFVSGSAVKDAAEKLVKKMKETAMRLYELAKEPVIAGRHLYREDGSELDTLEGFARRVADYSGDAHLTAAGEFKCEYSPPPFVTGFVRLWIDTETGKVALKHFAAVADCGTVINPVLARVQVHGGCVQSMGYALYEDVRFSSKGKLLNDTLKTYHIPDCMEVPPMDVEFMPSYEPLGPFGAKSIGEVAFHTPVLAIREAIYHGTGCRLNNLPMTPEKILRAIRQKEAKGERLPC